MYGYCTVHYCRSGGSGWVEHGLTDDDVEAEDIENRMSK